MLEKIRRHTMRRVVPTSEKQQGVFTVLSLPFAMAVMVGQRSGAPGSAAGGRELAA